MYPVAGAGGTCPGGNDDVDQADGGGLQQVDALPSDGSGVAAVSTTTTTVTTTTAATTTAATTTAATTTAATTATATSTSGRKGVGDKGKKPASRRGRRSYTAGVVSPAAATVRPVREGVGDRGKKPAPKRGRRSYTAGVVSPTSAAVHSVPTGAGVLGAVDITSSQEPVECCGFHICTSDLLELRRMEGDFLSAVEGMVASIFR
ncbi:hypothetical protein, partial [Candidatus Ichthyocystis hellenicum]|uniref:hypothetical protein n=1 Tax=Candidatus Ichthyocystis hellenicum TaxID=1561003 RepID=UPI001F5E93B6